MKRILELPNWRGELPKEEHNRILCTAVKKEMPNETKGNNKCV